MKRHKRKKHLLDKQTRKGLRTETLRQKEQVERTVKRRIGLLIGILSSLAGFITLRVGEHLWHPWLVEHRTRIIAILIFSVIVVALSSPLVIEYSKNPRRLSGSDVDGKNLLE